MRRIAGWLVAMVLVAAGTWVVADRLESPAQIAARAEPPSPVPVTAPLRTGNVHARMTLTLTAVQDSRAVAGGEGVVTRTAVAAGDSLEPGELLANVDGRPRIALTGPFALYRDLGRGDHGDDVAALQDGLREAGYRTGGDKAGVFGAGTMAALKRLYENAGATLPTRTPEEGSPVAATPVEAAPPSGSVEGAPPASPPQLESYLPPQEVVMLTGLPATVGSVAGVGQSLDGEHPLLQLLSSEVRLSATVPTGSQGSLVVGAQGTFTDADGAVQTATVTGIDASADGSEVMIRTDSPGRVEVGASYVLTIDNPAAEQGQAILAPVAGVVTRGGRTYIYTRDGDEFAEVAVTVTASTGSVVAIEPIDPAQELEDGTEIKIG
ncbi:peptidoglycan-binding domain-containing protein [Georgenia yuyongxinii]